MALADNLPSLLPRADVQNRLTTDIGKAARDYIEFMGDKIQFDTEAEGHLLLVKFSDRSTESFNQLTFFGDALAKSRRDYYRLRYNRDLAWAVEASRALGDRYDNSFDCASEVFLLGAMISVKERLQIAGDESIASLGPLRYASYVASRRITLRPMDHRE